MDDPASAEDLEPSAYHPPGPPSSPTAWTHRGGQWPQEERTPRYRIGYLCAPAHDLSRFRPRGSVPSGLDRRRVPGLINGEVRAVWQADRRKKPPALVADITCHFDSLAPQLSEGGLDVVTHEVELVMACPISGVNGQLGRGQGENEPASTRVRRPHAQYVGEECADLLGVRGKHDRMYSRDHIAILAAAPPVAVICPHSRADPVPCRDEVSESRHRRCRSGD